MVSSKTKTSKKPANSNDSKRLVHWADQVVKRVIAEKGNKKTYVCAAGITPSGTIHIGNFREIITVDLVARAFKDAGKKSRFIYSWDDYDVFRKVPKNMPNQEMLEKHLRKSIIDVPDPFGTEESYARHHEVDVEKAIEEVGIYPEFLYQAKKYRNLDYVSGIKIALKKRDEIKQILDAYRKEPLAKDWLPITGFCPECGKDTITFSNYNGDNEIQVTCNSCSFDSVVKIDESPFLKLPWRMDWPMRWAYEKVDFEPGGKEHSTPGGSYTTAKEIVSLYDWTAPSYQMYDFISIKGTGGKISSSLGNVITLKDMLEIYEPEMVRWLFAGTRPNSEFAISFDLDVIKLYEDFDKCERIYFGKQDVKEKEKIKQSRIYELSMVSSVPKKMPFQPSFRHLTNILLINRFNMDAVLEHYASQLTTKEDKERLLKRAVCAKNWIEKYAPDNFKYEVQSVVPKTFKASKSVIDAMREIAGDLIKQEWTDKELHERFYVVMKKHGVETPDFFKACYNALINRDKGPQLASFILSIGTKKVSELFEKIK